MRAGMMRHDLRACMTRQPTPPGAGADRARVDPDADGAAGCRSGTRGARHVAASGAVPGESARWRDAAARGDINGAGTGSAIWVPAPSRRRAQR